MSDALPRKCLPRGQHPPRSSTARDTEPVPAWSGCRGVSPPLRVRGVSRLQTSATTQNATRMPHTPHTRHTHRQRTHVTLNIETVVRPRALRPFCKAVFGCWVKYFRARLSCFEREFGASHSSRPALADRSPTIPQDFKTRGGARRPAAAAARCRRRRRRTQSPHSGGHIDKLELFSQKK